MTGTSSFFEGSGSQGEKKHGALSNIGSTDPMDEDERRSMYRRPLRGMDQQNRHCHHAQKRGAIRF